MGRGVGVLCTYGPIRCLEAISTELLPLCRNGPRKKTFFYFYLAKISIIIIYRPLGMLLQQLKR